MQGTRKSGFTLVELMVVLAIAAIIASITFGAFRSVSEGNKRSSCQANLSQIYQSCRLYAQDYNGKFPYLNPLKDATTSVAPTGTNAPDATPPGGIGLWSLYTYRKTGDQNCTYPQNSVDLPLPESEVGASALTGYIKNIRIFHCPADSFKRNIEYRLNPSDSTSACTPATVDSDVLTFTPTAPTKRLNPAYLSYQTGDDVQDDPTAAPDYSKPVNTYSSFRQPSAQKQLIFYTNDSGVTKVPERPSNDNTVITWCRFHRINKAVEAAPGEIASQTDRRSYDNVLFYDGTVQNLPVSEDPTNFSACTGTNCLTGWKRIPKRPQ